LGEKQSELIKSQPNKTELVKTIRDLQDKQRPIEMAKEKAKTETQTVGDQIIYQGSGGDIETIDLTKLKQDSKKDASLAETLRYSNAEKDRKSTITQLYKAYATGDITKEQLDSAYSKYGVDIKQAEYAVLDSLTTEEKAPFILEKLTSPQSTKQDLDDMVSTKLLTSPVVTEMEDKGMISENQAKVLKNYIKQKTYKSKAKKFKVFKPKISRLKLTSRRRGDTKKIRSGLTLKDLYKKR